MTWQLLSGPRIHIRLPTYLPACMHAYLHTCILTYMQHMHHAYVCTYTCIPTCMHTSIHACMHTYICTYISTYLHLYTHIPTCLHTCIHAYMHAYIHTLRSYMEPVGSLSRQWGGLGVCLSKVPMAGASLFNTAKMEPTRARRSPNPKASCSCIVHTWSLSGLGYHDVRVYRATWSLWVHDVVARATPCMGSYGGCRCYSCF